MYTETETWFRSEGDFLQTSFWESYSKQLLCLALMRGNSGVEFLAELGRVEVCCVQIVLAYVVVLQTSCAHRRIVERLHCWRTAATVLWKANSSE
eukprot:jgi/Botrbrau1/14588/Bobra.0312s0011.1